MVETEINFLQVEGPQCDPATKPRDPADRPPGYSNASYVTCDKTTNPPSWVWIDPQVAV